MDENKNAAVKKAIVLAAVIVFGLLMPYLARIPLAFTYGIAWIWVFIDDAGAFMRWNGGQLVSLVFVAMFGIVYVFTRLRWSFYLSVAVHYAITIYLYCDLMAVRHSDDFLGFIVAPLFIAPASLAAALAGLIVQQVLDRRERKSVAAVAGGTNI
ncbi:MAG: hypothetical protein ABJA02_16065 [Acidobacteriota bacterium]